MEGLVFLLGIMAGGIIALTIMAMFFVAKSADEVEVTGTSYRSPCILPQDTEGSTVAPGLSRI